MLLSRLTEKISPIPLLTEYRENGYKIIGNVGGRLSEQKVWNTLLMQVPGVIEKFPKTKFVIVGRRVKTKTNL